MTLKLRVAAMFDGAGVTGPRRIEAVNGRITAVRYAGTPDPEEGDVLDFGPDSFLLPGLVDVPARPAFATGDAATLRTMRVAALAALRAGITTVRDPGDRGYLALELAEEFWAHPDRGPHLLVAGPPVPAGADQVRAAVRERYERGCSVVRIGASGGPAASGPGPFVPRHSLADLKVAVDEAHRLGLPVAARAHGAPAIADAVRAGVDCLEHATFATPGGSAAPEHLLRQIAASQVFLLPD